MFYGFRNMPLPHSNFLTNSRFSVTQFVKKVKNARIFETIIKGQDLEFDFDHFVEGAVVFLPMVSKRGQDRLVIHIKEPNF